MRFSSGADIQKMIDVIAKHESDGNGSCTNPDCKHWPLESPWPNHVGTQIVKAFEEER
jgi:hypothetical protein